MKDLPRAHGEKSLVAHGSGILSVFEEGEIINLSTRNYSNYTKPAREAPMSAGQRPLAGFPLLLFQLLSSCGGLTPDTDPAGEEKKLHIVSHWPGYLQKGRNTKPESKLKQTTTTGTRPSRLPPLEVRVLLFEHGQLASAPVRDLHIKF